MALLLAAAAKMRAKKAVVDASGLLRLQQKQLAEERQRQQQVEANLAQPAWVAIVPQARSRPPALVHRYTPCRLHGFQRRCHLLSITLPHCCGGEVGGRLEAVANRRQGRCVLRAK